MAEADAGFEAIRPRLRRRLTCLFGHRVADDACPLVAHVYRHPTVGAFASALDYLRRHFRFVTLDDVIAHVRDGRALPDFALFLSFDDGMRSMIEVVAPMLRRAAIPATFFLTADAVDNRHLFYGLRRSYLIGEADAAGRPELAAALRALSIHGAEGRTAIDRAAAALGVDWRAVLAERRPYMTREECRALLDMGFTLGAHGASHRKFVELDADGRARELAASVDFLKSAFGVERPAFAFPHSHEGVEKRWMAERLAAEAGPSIFFGTGGYVPGDRVLVHRVGFDRPPGDGGAFDIGGRIAHAWRRAADKYGLQ